MPPPTNFNQSQMDNLVRQFGRELADFIVKYSPHSAAAPLPNTGHSTQEIWAFYKNLNQLLTQWQGQQQQTLIQQQRASVVQLRTTRQQQTRSLAARQRQQRQTLLRRYGRRVPAYQQYQQLLSQQRQQRRATAQQQGTGSAAYRNLLRQQQQQRQAALRQYRPAMTRYRALLGQQQRQRQVLQQRQAQARQQQQTGRLRQRQQLATRQQQQRLHVTAAYTQIDKEKLQREEKQELQHRQELNDRLRRSTLALNDFRSILVGMTQGGMQGGMSAISGLTALLASTGPIGALIAGITNVLTAGYTIIDRIKQEGVATLNPSLARTGQQSERLEDMERARVSRRSELERSINTERQANAAVLRARTERNETYMNDVDVLRMRRNERLTREHEAELRRMGVLREGERFKPKEDLVLPASPGITTAMQYQSELQIGTLHREDLTNQILREQIDELQRQGVLLERIDQRIGNIGPIQPHWG